MLTGRDGEGKSWHPTGEIYNPEEIPSDRRLLDCPAYERRDSYAGSRYSAEFAKVQSTPPQPRHTIRLLLSLSLKSPSPHVFSRMERQNCHLRPSSLPRSQLAIKPSTVLRPNNSLDVVTNTVFAINMGALYSSFPSRPSLQASRYVGPKVNPDGCRLCHFHNSI